MAVPRGCQSRAGTPISLIAIHTSEGARTARDLMGFLDGPVEASYHVLVDDTETIRYLPDDVACWAMLSGNPRSLQVCLTGFAAWPRAVWLGEHRAMLQRAAAVVADWCQRYRIPAVKLTPAQVGADQRGVCGHWDWTLGKRDGTHTDPGPNFPWDVFIDLVAAGGDHNRGGELDVPKLDRTPVKTGCKLGDHPDGSWPATEDVISLGGPAGGWHGRVIVHPVVGFGGAWVQEAWWAPSGLHIIDKDKGLYLGQFEVPSWEAPDNSRALVLRYAAPTGGSVGIETEH